MVFFTGGLGISIAEFQFRGISDAILLYDKGLYDYIKRSFLAGEAHSQLFEQFRMYLLRIK